MKRHAFGEPLRNIKVCIKRIWKEMKKCMAKQSDSIFIVGPIDEHAAPYHYNKNRKIDPMRPADGERMFFINGFYFLLFIFFPAQIIKVLSAITQTVIPELRNKCRLSFQDY